MSHYIIRRLLGAPFLILGITLVTFLLIHLTPGSPVDSLRLNHPNMKPEDIRNIETTLGINEPLHEQYLGWLGQLVRGDLGISLKDYRPVRDSIFERLKNTLLLTTSALLIALAIGAPVGVLAAIKRNSVFDYIATVSATVWLAIPGVWLGILLILLFSVQFKEWGLPWLPSSGTQTIPGGGDVVDRFKHMIMPVMTLAVVEAAGFVKFFRFLMLETLNQDYIRTARAKGLRERVVIVRHAMRNAIVPFVTALGMTIPGLFGGAVIVENIFSWPGVGSYAALAAINKDYTAIMGTVLFISVITVLANLLADILTVVADPRIRLDTRR